MGDTEEKEKPAKVWQIDALSKSIGELDKKIDAVLLKQDGQVTAPILEDRLKQIKTDYMHEIEKIDNKVKPLVRWIRVLAIACVGLIMTLIGDYLRSRFNG